MTRSIPTAALAVLLCSAMLLAATTDNFDVAGTPATGTQSGSAPGPVPLGGGPTANYLRLVNDGVNSQRNHYSYDLSDPGAFGTVNTRFDFAGFSSDQPADGWSASLIPTSVYGSTGMGPNLSESANAAGTLGIGFRNYPGGTNDIALHWNGTELGRNNIPLGTASFRDGTWHTAQLDVQQIGRGSNVKVTILPDIHGTPGAPQTVLHQYVSNLLPYENRLQFSGRTGGANMDVNLDNVNVAYSQPGTLSAVSPGTTYQDFDTLNTTPFVGIESGTGAGPVVSTGGPTGNYLRLVNDTGNQANRIAFDRAGDGLLSNYEFKGEFDFRATSAGLPADGFSMVLLPTQTYGAQGGGAAFPAEEPSVTGALGIGFDLHPSPLNEVSLHYNGGVIATNNVPTASIDLDANKFHHAEVTARQVTGGSRVTVELTPDIHGAPGAPVTVFNDVFVANMVPYDYRVQFAGRTGGRYHDLDLDNVSVTRTALPQAGTDTVQNFDSLGSAYIAATHGSFSPPEILDEGGNKFLRLVRTANGQDNVIAFDRTAPGLYQRLQASFDLRVGSGADGGALAFLNTADYDTAGAGPASGPFPGGDGWEEANMPNTFAIGFDIYNNIHEVSLHWDNAVRANATSAFDYRNAGFNTVDVTVDFVPGGGTVSLDIAGTPVYTNYFVPGLTPYEARLALGARTGGVTTNYDVDNISVQYLNPLAAPGGPFDWIGMTGNYTDASKWVGGVVPTGNDNARIPQGICLSNSHQQAGTGSLTVTGLGRLDNTGVLRVGAGGTAGTVTQTGGSIYTSSDFYVADGGSHGSVYNISSGELWIDGTHTVIGRGGVGHVVQNGGTVRTERLFLAEFGGSGGSTWTMHDGVLNVDSPHREDPSLGDPFALEIGRSEAATFTMHNGELNLLQGKTLMVGRGANGVLTVHNGLVNATGRLHLGRNAGVTGELHVNNGTINVGSYFVVGDSGIGLVTQTGGDITSSNRTILGDQVGSRGTYTMSGGTLTCNGLTLSDKGSIAAVFNQSGGTVTVNGRVAINENSSSTAAYTLSGDGVINANGDYFIVGRGGPASFDQSGTSVVNVNVGNRFLLADNAGSGGSTYTIADDAVLNVNNGKEMSLGKSGQGTFTQTGGTVNASGNLRLGEGGNQAIYNLQGGQLNVNNLLRNGPQSQFNFAGGRLSATTVGFDLLNQGGTTAPGQSIGITTVDGSYTQQAAGTLEIEVGGLAGPGVDPDGWDVLVVNGQVNLDGVLDLIFTNGFDPAEMDSFVIVDNDSTDDINGEFDGLGEGDTFYVPTASLPLAITYAGGTGNDVAVTAVPEPATMALLGLAACGLGGYVRRRRRA